MLEQTFIAGLTFAAIYHAIKDTVTTRDIEDCFREQARLARAVKALEYQLKLERDKPAPEASLPRPEPLFVTCGGCGHSVLTTDGFNPMAHRCDALTEK